MPTRWLWSLPRWGFAVACLIVPLLSGCGSLAKMGMFPEVETRRPPRVAVGPALALLGARVERSTAFIGANGRAQVFAIDANNQLHHIEIFGNTVVARESLGAIEGGSNARIDALEWRGQLRVLAGDKQYVRGTDNAAWLEIKGNRCARFAPLGDELFCAFVIKGGEIGAPKRTDWTWGWFILFPVAFWSTTDAAKLVIAQESDDSWKIRAVVDAENPLDADNDFLAGTDNLGNLHLLYFASRGGGAFVVAAGTAPGALGGGFAGHDAELRHATVPIDQMLSHGKAGDGKNLAPGTANGNWLPISSVMLAQAPFKSPGMPIRPLDRRFSIHKESGVITGLLWAREAHLSTDARSLYFGNENGWAEVWLQEGRWTSQVDLIAVEDLPDSTYNWAHEDDHALIENRGGSSYALLENCALGFWESTCSLVYFEKNSGRWSAPLVLGPSFFRYDGRALAVNDRGCALATWVNPDGNFIGRWIGPCGDSPPK